MKSGLITKNRLELLPMEWQDETNYVDCGVHRMHYMEVYKGQGESVCWDHVLQ